MDKKDKRELCEICGHHVPGYNAVYLSSEEKPTLVCLKCYNQRISNYTGFDFEHVEFKPIMIKDADGVDHKFHFNVRLLGGRVAIDTFEIKDGQPGGYELKPYRYHGQRYTNVMVHVPERFVVETLFTLTQTSFPPVLTIPASSCRKSTLLRSSELRSGTQLMVPEGRFMAENDSSWEHNHKCNRHKALGVKYQAIGGKFFII